MNYLAFAVQNARDEFQPLDLAIQADADEMDQALVTPPPTGPRECCLDFWHVVECDNRTDLKECWVCGYRWSEPCR